MVHTGGRRLLTGVYIREQRADRQQDLRYRQCRAPFGLEAYQVVPAVVPGAPPRNHGHAAESPEVSKSAQVDI